MGKKYDNTLLSSKGIVELRSGRRSVVNIKVGNLSGYNGRIDQTIGYNSRGLKFEKECNIIIKKTQEITKTVINSIYTTKTLPNGKKPSNNHLQPIYRHQPTLTMNN